MEEEPFESLARGLNNKDLSGLLDKEESALTSSTRASRLGSIFGMPDLSIGLARRHETSFVQQHPFLSLSDRFAGEIAVFPLANHVVINKFGAFIPQSMFGADIDIAYKEERNQSGDVNVTVHPQQPRAPAARRPQFGSARGLLKISDDFDEPLEDFIDYM